MSSSYRLRPPGEADPSRLRDRVVLVTGAAGGIGAPTALACARAGATVIALDRNQRGLDRVYDAIVAAGGPEPVQVREDLATLDVARADSLAAQIDDAFGRVDALLWLAHEPAPLSPLEHYRESTWLRVVHASASAPWILFRALAPLLSASESARVVLASGDAGRHARAYHGATALGWSALDALARLLAEEFEKRPSLRAFSVDPGAVHTPMRIGWFPGDDPDALAEPERVADAFTYLASPASAEFDGPLCRIVDGELREVS